VRLERGAAERLVLAAARDHFYAADVLDSPGVAAAQRCLALLPDSPAARAEGDAIAALLRLHREHSYAMLPAAFKQVTWKVASLLAQLCMLMLCVPGRMIRQAVQGSVLLLQFLAGCDPRRWSCCGE